MLWREYSISLCYLITFYINIIVLHLLSPKKKWTTSQRTEHYSLMLHEWWRWWNLPFNTSSFTGRYWIECQPFFCFSKIVIFYVSHSFQYIQFPFPRSLCINIHFQKQWSKLSTFLARGTFPCSNFDYFLFLNLIKSYFLNIIIKFGTEYEA